MPPADASNPPNADGLSAEAWQHMRWNFRFGVLNGVFFTLADAFITPALVLPLFVSRLSDSHVLVGLPLAIFNAAWLLPQLFIASRVQHLARKMPWYSRAGAVRGLSILSLAGLLWAFAGTAPGTLLLLFFTFYILYTLGAGVAAIPWIEVVGKTIPPRRRGSFFGLRNFYGGGLAFLASGLVSYIVSQGAVAGGPLAFPHNFALLFGVAGVLVSGGVISWALVREPAEMPRAERMAFWAQIRRGPALLRADRGYRAFALARLLLAFSAVADPFYIVFAKEQLGVPVGLVGLYLAAVTVAAVLSNLVWGPVANRAPNHVAMRVSAAAVLVVPLLALGGAATLRAAGLLAPAADGSAQPGHYLFAGVFILWGFATGAGPIINSNVILNLAPPDERPFYIGFLNTLLGLATLVPILGGTLVDHLGYEPVFLLAAALASGALWASGGLRAAQPSPSP